MEVESKIFKNEEILFPEYLPEILPHRENQIKLLADNLLATLKGRRLFRHKNCIHKLLGP